MQFLDGLRNVDNPVLQFVSAVAYRMCVFVVLVFLAFIVLFVHNSVHVDEWWGAGVVVCLEQGADLHTAQAQLMPLHLTVSCFS